MANYTFTPQASAYYRSLFPDGPTPSGHGVVLPAVSSGLSVTGPSVITWGSTATFTVTMTNGADRALQVIATRDSIKWSVLANLTTDASGTASFGYRAATNLYYRAVFAGAPDLAGESSAALRTVVRETALPRNYTSRTTAIRRGTTVSIATTIRPDRPELPTPVVTFRVYRRTGSSWTSYRTVTVTANSSGLATLRWTFGTTGSWYVTSMANSTPNNANSTWTARRVFRVS
jgi:hypothetical protein